MDKLMELTIYGTASLGAVIDALRAADPDSEVQFDFCYLSPTGVASYRGYYDHLALGWEQSEEPPYWPKASDLLARLEAAIGHTFEGWKGGHYRMSRDTPLWVANRGETGGTGIVGIRDEGHSVIIETAKVD